jgi:hypothetical protein
MATDPYPFAEEGLTAALAALGDTADAVAGTLTAGGWRGLRDECTACPVAVYLKSLYGDVHVEVSQVQVSIEQDMWIDQGYEMGYTAHLTVVVETPDPVADFVSDFDSLHRYSHLEAA